jgi:RNA polymerase sigma-70 factor (ECF subfamily)
VVACHRLDDELEAEEIVQNIFVGLWNRRKALKINHTLNTYLSVAVKYQVITRLAQLRRKERHERYFAASVAEGMETTSAYLLEKELRLQIEQCITRLPEKCRIVFVMSREKGLNNASIAEALNITEKTVEGHITKALHLLRTSLKISLPFLLFLLGE